MKNQYLIFKLGKESYALNIANVREVIEYIEPEKVPNSEKHILGMLSIRNEIIALMDSKVILNSETKINKETSKIVIFEQSDSHIGIAVDSVSEVVEIEESEISPSPHLEMNDTSNSYVKGVVTKNDKLIIVIDSSKTKLNVNEEVVNG